MKKTTLLLIMTAIALCPTTAQELCDLQTEHLPAPLGLDSPHPRLSWRMQTDRPRARQTHYRLLVGTDSAAVASGNGSQWDTGLQEDAAMMVHYAGEPLQPFTKYFWMVQSTDEQGTVTQSPVAHFEMGMMESSQWRGAWIDDNQRIDFLPAALLRRSFRLDKPAATARIYIAAAGLYELHLNGHRVGDHMLDPLYTRFDRRNYYVTYDVTNLLNEGENVVGVVLGNGWYNHQSMGVWDFERAPWRNRPAVCLDLRITFQDGSDMVIPTYYGWRCSTGEVVQNNIYTGEHRDFRLVQQGWDKPGFNDSKWRNVHLRTAPSMNVTAQQARPIRVDRVYKPVDVRQLSDSVWVYDFGQNMAGVVRMKAHGPEGARMRIRHGERLHEDGSIDLSSIDIYFRGDPEKDPFQTDVVTLSGKDDEYTAQFGYKGFRYVQVEGVKPDSLHALFLHSDVPQVGWIESSSPLIDKLMHASRMSYLSNLMGLPTDCPQREKNGWTGDGHLAIEAGLYNFDAITIYEKWMADHRDEQQPNGVLPDIIPTGGWGYGGGNGLDWTSTIAIIPWTLYLFYGDDQALRDCYPHIRRYVDYVDRCQSHDGLTSWGRGDWVPVSKGSNIELTSSVYYYVDARILARAARMFGYEWDALHYDALARSIRDAINRKFLNREEGIYASGTQTELSVPLCWGVVPDDCRQKVAGRLNQMVINAGYHLDVGVLGCKALLNALCQNGYTETAYRVAVQDTYPSWGYWMVKGCTTLLETWTPHATKDITKNLSDNHMMFGEIGAWFYKGLAGIYPDEQDPGFRHILLRPWFPQDLNSFTARHISPYGEIRSGWKRKGRKLTYTAVIPPCSTATLTLPDGTVHELASGTHQFSLRADK